jgi:hypothetical protein
MRAGESNSKLRVYQEARKLALVAAGILAGQIVLYGPAFSGAKVLLPLGCLTEQNKYIPHPPGAPALESRQPVLLDLVTLTEPDRRFAAGEIAAGRFPRWNPYEFGGVPFTWPNYSPYFLFAAWSESPVMIAWAQLFAAMVAGFGAFAFCRRVLKLGYWPSALAAWCYPITGWFVLFQGYAACVPVIWLPWLCLASGRAIRAIRGNRAGPVGLAIAVALVVVSGNLDVACQVLLIAGLFSLWSLWDVHRRGCLRFLLGKGGLTLVLGWVLGLLLAAPYVLPLVEYTQTSSRISRRAAGAEERPPVGIAALPQLVLPDMYGVYAEKGTCPLIEPVESNQIESPAEGYTGLVLTLLLAPWALLDRRRRSVNAFFIGLAAFGASWCLNVPGIVHLLRLPGMNLMSHNRLLFATSFAILCLAAIGFENLLAGELSRRRPSWMQAALLAVLLGWSCYRTTVFPEPLATEFETRIQAGKPDIWAPNMQDLGEAQDWFRGRYQRAAALATIGLAIWLLLHFRPAANQRMARAIGAVVLADLLLFGYGKRILQDEDLYYPPIPALRAVANAPPGRIIGIGCLPANLAQAVGLRDVRGFDSVDPDRWLRLLATASPKQAPDFAYAAVQWFTPRWQLALPDAVQLSPVLDMLAVRYAIFRGAPMVGTRPRFQSSDYWVMENRSALPRVYVPRRVEAIPDGEETLRRLASPEFDAHQVAFVEAPIDFPAAIRGDATIAEEIPTRISVDAHMEMPGLLVLADNWDKGWRAYVNGTDTPILRVNYTLRGVVLPTGTSRVEFRYESTAVRLGSRLAVIALTVLVGFVGAMFWGWRRSRAAAAATADAA